MTKFDVERKVLRCRLSIYVLGFLFQASFSIFMQNSQEKRRKKVKKVKAQILFIIIFQKLRALSFPYFPYDRI